MFLSLNTKKGRAITLTAMTLSTRMNLEFSMTLNYRKTNFVLSAANARQFPKDALPEVAFVGRSNVGKSSLLNMLTEQKNLAKTSKTPGRTQLVNFFVTEDKARLVDLPGYGFADVPEAIQKQWNSLMYDYLVKREHLLGVLILLDIRRMPSEHDLAMINMVDENKIPFLIVLTKSDKLSKNEAFNQQHKIAKSLNIPPNRLLVTSTLSKQGVSAVRESLNALFDDFFAVQAQIDIATQNTVSDKPQS